MSLYIYGIQAVPACSARKLNTIRNRVLKMKLDSYEKQAQAFADLVSTTCGWKPAPEEDGSVCLDWYQRSSLCPVTLPDGNRSWLHVTDRDGTTEVLLIDRSETGTAPYMLTEFRISGRRLVIGYEERADIASVYHGGAVRGTLDVIPADAGAPRQDNVPWYERLERRIVSSALPRNEKTYIRNILDYATDRDVPFTDARAWKAVAVPEEAFIRETNTTRK